MQIDHLDARIGDWVEEVGSENVHPAGAHDYVGARGERENE